MRRDIMDKSEMAMARFRDGLTCSQAVLSVFSSSLGLDENTALKVAAGFGGGMGRMGLTCGAVTGAIMVLGLNYGATSAQDTQAKLRTHELVREFRKRFESRHRSIQCRELLGCDLSTPEGLAQAKEKQLFTTVCPKYVAGAVEILEEMV
jgi:C_GCAxxG_C_C family probable redox protein